jgi:hypothetical protein
MHAEIRVLTCLQEHRNSLEELVYVGVLRFEASYN